MLTCLGCDSLGDFDRSVKESSDSLEVFFSEASVTDMETVQRRFVKRCVPSQTQ